MQESRIPPWVIFYIQKNITSKEKQCFLLNQEENKYNKTPVHKNSKRIYPYWKVCVTCNECFTCLTKEQATRNKYCSKKCIKYKKKKTKDLKNRKGMFITCAVCGTKKWKPTAWAKRTKTHTCGYICNGKLKVPTLLRFAHKGRAAWSKEAVLSHKQKMSGKNNHAWKGGVTYRSSKGSYRGAKYVLCPPHLMPMSRKDGYVMEHRKVVAEAIGRVLLRTEVVHHINHNPRDNDLSNLMLFDTNKNHKLYESNGTPPPIWRGDIERRMVNLTQKTE